MHNSCPSPHQRGAEQLSRGIIIMFQHDDGTLSSIFASVAQPVKSILAGDPRPRHASPGTNPCHIAWDVLKLRWVTTPMHARRSSTNSHGLLVLFVDCSRRTAEKSPRTFQLKSPSYSCRLPRFSCGKVSIEAEPNR